MNINLKSLLLGTSLSLIPNLTQAQCVATTDCATLGYTETSCPDGKGIRCPFGTTYACCSDNCVKNGFKYDCKGTGYASGSGQACNNKYTSCSCAKGYEWEDGKCKELQPILGQCTGYAKYCSVGQILNSDGTCTTNKESGKTPIGVVVYIGGGTDKCGYAMTASLINDFIDWGDEYADVPSLPNYTDEQDAIKDFDVSGNMIKIIQASNGDSSKFPAAYVAFNYAPNGAPTTKGKWMLPTAGILNSLCPNLNAINNAIYKLGGTPFEKEYTYIWSSTEIGSSYAWTLWLYVCSLDSSNKDINRNHGVRPVIAF